ncbi:MAG: ABC transporter ATP-binding protein, partial [Bdellovibrionaceae bacterium]|nr:ABC transporter ATP-binding protein [Pseudobdellovibrionaceae bacterium]
FEQPDSGEILLDGRSLLGIPPQRRPLNMVFQRYALFPHLSVFENVAYGLRVRRVHTDVLRKKVLEVLALVGLSDLAERKPETLSGGQAQRVALARAVVNEPRLLLLDEPLSALDQKMRLQMQAELRNLQRRLGLTFIMVTHDQEEAMGLSDRIALMRQGRVVQVGTPRELYEEPNSPFVADFIGRSSRMSAEVKEHGGPELNLKIGDKILSLRSTNNLGPLEKGAVMEIFIRPEIIRVAKEKLPEVNQFRGQIVQCVFRGENIEAHIEISGFGQIMAAIPSRHSQDIHVGEEVWVSLPQEGIQYFKGEN